MLTGRAGGSPAPSTAPTSPSEPIGSLIDLCDPTPPSIVDAFAASTPAAPPPLMAFEGSAFEPSSVAPGLQTAPSGNPFGGDDAAAHPMPAAHPSAASLASQHSTVSSSWGVQEAHTGHASQGSSALSLPTNSEIGSMHSVAHPYAVPPPPQLAVPMHPHALVPTPMHTSPPSAYSPYTPAQQPHTPAPSPYTTAPSPYTPSQPPVSPEPSDNNPFTENPFAATVAPKPSGAFSFTSGGAAPADDGAVFSRNIVYTKFSHMAEMDTVAASMGLLSLGKAVTDPSSTLAALDPLRAPPPKQPSKHELPAMRYAKPVHAVAVGYLCVAQAGCGRHCTGHRCWSRGTENDSLKPGRIR